MSKYKYSLLADVLWERMVKCPCYVCGQEVGEGVFCQYRDQDLAAHEAHEAEARQKIDELDR